MPSATAEETVELDLTIHARVLPAPSQRSAETGIDGHSSQNFAMGKVPLTLGTNCGTDVWDCTAPWVCG
jgi:hypothetical protein